MADKGPIYLYIDATDVMKKAEALLDRISDICISMKASDYLQLPEIVYHDVPVVLDQKSEKAYRDLERKMVLELPEDEESISVTSAAALSAGFYQMPVIEPDAFVPDDLIGFNYMLSTKRRDAGVHFFIDDYQFERIWNDPTR